LGSRSYNIIATSKANTYNNKNREKLAFVKEIVQLSKDLTNFNYNYGSSPILAAITSLNSKALKLIHSNFVKQLNPFSPTGNYYNLFINGIF